jgi:hypothetical protein
MVWIKRNLFFVISGAVGLLLTGYCGYLLYSSLNANSGVSDDYTSTVSNFRAIQEKTPYPSTENIQAAKADEDNVRKFLADFRTRFASFPTPPVEDAKGFTSYLQESLARFRAGATNAGVQMPDDYAFAFSGLIGKLTYPPGNIGPWMQQLEEIGAILDILYDAKINYLGSGATPGLQRVSVAADDIGAGDYLSTTSVTNQWGVVTPYKVTFRGFSAEIAAVLAGFARSSNCFIIKSVDVVADKSVQPLVMQSSPQQPGAAFVPAPRFTYPNPAFNQPQSRGRGGIPGMMRPMAPPPVAAPSVVPGAVAAVAAAPVTILSESPLLVTISVDVVKLKESDH